MVFKKNRRIFYIIWLAMGVFQLGDAAGAQLLSQETNENSVSEAGALPVRISRSFFEKQTSVQTNYISPGGSVSGNQLAPFPVMWRITWPVAGPIAENENKAEVPSVPSAGEQPLAVFKDHVGCAEIKELPPMQLCFNIQDDVSSLTLASNQMSVDGLNSVADLSCIADTRFIGAKKNGSSSFTVSYQLSSINTARCKNAGGVLNLTVQQAI